MSTTLIESDAGYRVMRCTTDGVPIDWYIAFRGRTTQSGGMPTVLGGWKNAEDARASCEAHHARYSEEVA